MGKKAPLVIFVYNRVDLTRKMLDAINKNTIANKTDVFIYSDGPKNEKDKQMVSEVRICIHKFSTQNNFKSVKIIESDYNKGLAKSIIEGVTEIIRANNRIIVLEDDLLAADNFLEFMNDCLDFYEKTIKYGRLEVCHLNCQQFQLTIMMYMHATEDKVAVGQLGEIDGIKLTGKYPIIKNS